MDKFEYKLKLDEMKSLTAEGKYQQAAEITDSINWHKIKNVNDLIKAGEIYEKVERYEESREILLMAYDRTPIGRTIIYRLAEISIKMGKFDEAEDYYQEFVSIAPHDNLRYVLRYEISKASGADLNTLIEILEELKTQEYSEEWAFELVTLYQQAGMKEKCIDACDELILWFGDGPYVERALEVKMAYEPLNAPQEEKYRQLKQKKEEITEIYPEYENDMFSGMPLEYGREDIPDISGGYDGENAADISTAYERKNISDISAEYEGESTVKMHPDYENESIVEVRPDDALESGEIVNNTVKIPKIKLSPDRFNTQSLQDIVKFGMRTITGATKEDEISTGMAMIKQAVEEVPNMHITSELPKVKVPEVSAEEVYAESHPDYKNLIAEDYQGQLSFLVPEQSVREPQITGQLSIGDLMAEWEHAQEEARQRNLKAAKEQAIRDVVDIMSQLSEVLPVLDSGMTPQELLQQYQEGDVVEDEKAAAFVVQMNRLLQQQMEEISRDTAMMQEEISAAKQTEQHWKERVAELSRKEPDMAGKSFTGDYSFPEETSKGPSADGGSLPEEAAEGQAVSLGDLEGQPVAESNSFLGETEGQPVAESNSFLGETEGQPVAENTSLSGEEGETVENSAEDAVPVQSGKQQTKVFPQVDLPESGRAAASGEQSSEEQMEEAILREAMKSMEVMNATAPTQKIPKITQEDNFPAIKKLSKELREIFTYFVSIKGMETQICQAINGIGKHLTSARTAAVGNLMIRGGSGSGKTVLATAMIRALQRLINRPTGKIGKIEASVLNQRDTSALIKKVAGGCLIIEKAGDISVKTANELAALLAGDESGLFLIVEDTHKGIEKFLSLNPSLAACFTERINIPVFTSDELVFFAKAYSNELGYKIDELGVLALYNSISNIQKLDHATTLTEVKDIVDGAIRRAEKGGMRKMFSVITSHRYDEEDYVILHEKDFGF